MNKSLLCVISQSCNYRFRKAHQVTNAEGTEIAAPKAKIDLTITNNRSEIIDQQQKDLQGPYYNLNGQRVSRPSKGIYIVNGKKVIFK